MHFVIMLIVIRGAFPWRRPRPSHNLLGAGKTRSPSKGAEARPPQDGEGAGRDASDPALVAPGPPKDLHLRSASPNGKGGAWASRLGQGGSPGLRGQPAAPHGAPPPAKATDHPTRHTRPAAGHLLGSAASSIRGGSGGATPTPRSPLPHREVPFTLSQ